MDSVTPLQATRTPIVEIHLSTRYVVDFKHSDFLQENPSYGKLRDKPQSVGGMTRKGNCIHRARVNKSVKRALQGILLVLSLTSALAYDFYSSARQKVDLIESGRLQPGARVDLSLRELNAIAEHEAPAGVRDPQVVVDAPDVVTGRALVDFGKVRRAQGYQPGWLMAKLLDGERPVSVTARVRSSAGKVTVEVQRAEVAGLEIDGAVLDFLVQNFVIPLYPEAMIGRPIPMGFRIDRLLVAPAGVAVMIGR